MLISQAKIFLWLSISSAISTMDSCQPEDEGLLGRAGKEGKAVQGCVGRGATALFLGRFHTYCTVVSGGGLGNTGIQGAAHKCEQGLKCTAGNFPPLLIAFGVAGKQLPGIVHPCIMEPFVVMFQSDLLVLFSEAFQHGIKALWVKK